MASPVGETPLEGQTAAPARRRDLAALGRRAASILAWAYPLSLLATMAAFRVIGERWWATAVAMYLPRIGFALPLPLLILAVFLSGAPRAAWVPLAMSVPILLWLAGFVLPWPVRADPKAPSLRLMSYNVNSEEAGNDPIIQEIDRYSPDVLFLVEHRSEEIVPLLQARYASVRVSGQFVIASRFPVTSNIDPDKLHYSGRLRSPRWLEEVLDTPLGPIAFYEVHPLSPRDGLNAVRGLGMLHKIKAALGLSFASQDIVAYNSGLRELQVADFVSYAEQEKNPVVIAGDTNLPGLSYVLHHSLSAYHDGFAQAGWGFGYTFPTGKHHPWMRIDRVMASDELRFTHFEVGSSFNSDHECVVADLQRAQ